MRKRSGIKTTDFSDGALATGSLMPLQALVEAQVMRAARICALRGEDGAEVLRFLDMLGISEEVRALRAG